MPYSDYQDYVRAIPILKAQESLEQIPVYSFANCKNEIKNKIYKKLHKQANPDIWNTPKKAISLEEVARMLKNGR
jgi:hypothetical protein